jgi:hypothetical protein
LKESKIMKNTHVKNALLGILIALAATYLFPVVLFTILDWPRGFRVIWTVLPWYGLLYSSWLVIPLGVALGLLIPQMARGKSRWSAALSGAGIGAVAGLVSVYCFTSVYGFRGDTGIIWLSVMAYSALWVGGYAFYCAKGQHPYR